MVKFLIPTLFLFFTELSVAQHFNPGEKYVVSTSQINSSGFSFLMLSNIKRTNLDSSVPFSVLHNLICENGRLYQVVLQKDFEGTIIAMGLDLALIKIYECRKQYLYPINYCIEKRLQNDFMKDEENACILCLIERLNQCF